MKYLKRYELFDSTSTDITVDIDSEDEFKTLFNIEDVNYFFQARWENKIQPESIRYGWYLGFGVEGTEDKYLKTGLGKQFKILPLIYNSLKLFINKYNPEKISFISEGDSKTTIYDSIINKLGDFEMSKVDSELESFSGEIPWLVKYTKKSEK